MTTILQCPICKSPLLKSAVEYQCINRHTFDIARQGYVNLMLSHKKHSKEPGDSTEMIHSRRRFLDQGFYDRLSEGINKVVADILNRYDGMSHVTILDAGCGEGYYLRQLREYLTRDTKRSPPDLYGIDISKYAISKAAQRDKEVTWGVANIADLPFLPASLDIILNIFALSDFVEFSRIINDRGRVITVTPGPRHLNGLREIIYPVVREHAESGINERAGRLFNLSSSTRINYNISLEGREVIMDLLSMTPYFWNIDLTTKSRVESIDRLDLDVDVVISVFEKGKGEMTACR